MITLDDLVERVKTDVETVRQEFDKPDDDWLPFMVMTDGENFGLVGIDPDFMGHDFLKDILAGEVIPEALQQFEATGAAFVSSAWQAWQTPEGPDIRQVRPRDHPDREEVVFIAAVMGDELALWEARITRYSTRPPELEPWVDHSPDPEMVSRIEGRFIEGMRKGLGVIT